MKKENINTMETEAGSWQAYCIFNSSLADTIIKLMTTDTFITLATGSGAWLAYGIFHSALAATRTKGWVARHWPLLYRHYRVIYNVTAAVTLLPVLWLLYASQTPLLWR